MIGTIDADILRTTALSPELGGFAIAHDLMAQPATIRETDDLHRALQALLEHGARELLVLDAGDKIVGFLGEADVARAYHAATASPATDP